MTTSPRFENMKYAHLRPKYMEAMAHIESLNLSPREYIEHFPAFVGHLTLARHLSLYEAYRMTQSVAGHIAEVGVALGSGSLLFAKLVKLFEPASLTLVHGFDWFKGAKVTEEERYVQDGECQVDEEVVHSLI